MLEYLYGEMFGSKIAWADRKECDTLSPTFLQAEAIFEPNISPYK